MSPGTRIRIKGGPWPERIDAMGCIATVPGDWCGVYPVNGLGRNEVLVLLDVDPIHHPTHAQGEDHSWWTCVMRLVDVVEQKPCPRCGGTGALPVGRDSDIEMVTGQEPAPLCLDCDGTGEVDH